MKKVAAAVFAIFILYGTCVSADDKMQEIIVKEGDTLWGIASTYLQDPGRWPAILKHNNLSMNDPNGALPGMKIKVPMLLIKEHLRKADLTYILNDVLYRRKEQPDWKGAKIHLDLFNEDGIRTMDDGEAHVKFYSGDILRIARKSLVILRPELKREEVNLLTGIVRTGRTKVITPTAEVNSMSAGSLFKARVRSDHSTIVQVEKGRAEVLGIDTGKKVVVEEGFANITFPKTDPSSPVKVPAMPGFEMADFNSRGEVIISRSRQGESAPDKTVKQAIRSNSNREKSETDKAEKLITKNSYRVQLSLNPYFSRIILDQVHPLTEQTDVSTERDYKVPDGRYYRRVSYTDEKGMVTEFYPLPIIEIDTVAPRLEVRSPENGTSTRQSMVNVDGTVDLGSIVTVNGHPVEVKSDGTFRWPLVLNSSGENKIRIVAKDLSDNQTVVERTINLRGRGED